jgi:Protein of unknown function (DUF835)
MLVGILFASGPAKAATFTVSQEQILVGTTDGTAGVQAEDGIRETMREADVAPDPLNYPSTQNLTKGTQVGGTFPADVQTSDGIYVQYREATPGPVTVEGNPGIVVAGCTWTACGNGMVSDNMYASSPAGGDFVEYQNFNVTVPAASAIMAVQVGYEAFDPTGNDRLGITISWDGGVSWCPARTVGPFSGTDPNAYAFADFTLCTGHSWTPSDFGANIVVSFTHNVQGGSPDTIYLDANVVRVTYQPLAYELALQYNWAGAASGQQYNLRIKGHVSTENVWVQVLTPPSTWTTRLTFTNTTDQVLTYTLAGSEFNSGNVSIRFVDALGPDPTPSDLWLDYVDIVTTVLAYHLDVVQIVTGITGSSPRLDIEGNISAGGENFNVSVWNFTANAWAVKMSSVFTSANQMHSAALLPDEIANGTVRIDYQDQNPADVVPATLTLDLVRVSTPDGASGLWGVILIGGVIVGIAAVALFVFFVLLARRRSSSGESPEAVDRRNGRWSRGTGSRANGGTPSPAPQIAIGDLRPGGTYLVDEQEPAEGVRALEHLTRMGRSGLLITRRNPLELQREFKLRHTKTVWLGDTPDSGSGLTLAVSLDGVATSVNDFLQTNPVGAVLIDGMRDLIEGNDFSSVLGFIRDTVKQVTSGQQILLVSMPSGIVGGRELKQLAQQLEVVRIV